MDKLSKQLNIFILLLPYPAHGHMIPAIDLAKLLASHGVMVTIITTSLTITHIPKNMGPNVTIKSIEVPCMKAELNEGVEKTDSSGATENSQAAKGGIGRSFFEAVTLLQKPFEKLLEETKPDCIVADAFFAWASDSGAKFGIPRLILSVCSCFSFCIAESMRIYQPLNGISSDSEYFIMPGLPHEIKFTAQHFPSFMKGDVDNQFTRLLKDINQAHLKSFGVIFYSFYELEPDYFDHCRNFLGRKVWHVGPFSSCDKSINENKGLRGKETTIDEHMLMKWLDSKKPKSVVYVCFGSDTDFKATQLKEIAMGLEGAGHEFIWVVRRAKSEETGDDEEEWLPQGFEERMEGKGLIIRGWAPQLMILNHDSVGGFVTHAGWNSTLEAITAGVPTVTWPVSADQFNNEIYLTQILKIGIPVGVKKWIHIYGDSIDKKAIECAMGRLMVGEEAEKMRKRAKILSEKAKNAVEEGGSSHSNLEALIEELKQASP